MSDGSCSVEELSNALTSAQEHNYQIVPIVGAGLSADCGIPIIMSVVRYFGKLRAYIDSGMGLPDTLLEIPTIKKQFALYKTHPWKFVEDFGWPDRFQLNDDLVSHVGAKISVDKQVREALDSMIPFINVPGSKAFDRLQEEIIKVDIPDEVKKIFESNWGKSRAFDVVGDWRRLILYFTNYQSDYADGLFARFGANRQPSLGHRFLTFLIKLFAIPTTFTFNFDSMIEQALQSEGATPRVFGMERGAGLPHSRLTRGGISVIKMHGSTHGLLLDEDLDHPLSSDYLKKFDELVSDRPVLLVVGCSDGDRRLRDIVSYEIQKRQKRERRRRQKIHNEVPSVIWLHYENNRPEFLGEDSRYCLTYKTNNPGATLQHVYSYLTSKNPAGRRPYLAHVQQPVQLGKNWTDDNSVPKDFESLNFELIVGGEAKDDAWIATASYSLLNRGNYFAKNGFHFIWVDLEALHTLAGVVASIIDQCRKYDPALAPSMLPFNLDSDEPEDPNLTTRTKELAAKRVARALRGTRFYVAFDSLEKFVSPATTHHGLTHMAISKRAAARLQHLVDFLGELTKSDLNLGESKIGVSVGELQSRFSEDDLIGEIGIDERINELKKSFTVSSEPVSYFSFENYFKDLDAYPLTSLQSLPDETSDLLRGTEVENQLRFALTLFNLSCFRRTRPLVALRRLIAPIIGCVENPQMVDKLLSTFENPIDSDPSGKHEYSQSDRPFFLKQLEGGGYWYNHSIRDFVYSRNTRDTKASSLRDCLNPATKNPEEKWRSTVFQLALSAITHERIANTWYSETFLQSQDSYAFLEFTYHRISSIRSIAKLRTLCNSAKPLSMAQPFVEGLNSCSNFIKAVGGSERNIQLLEGSDWQQPMEGKEPISDNNRDQITNIGKILEGRHWSDLITLHRAWSRAETLLRSQLPAEQLLHWCDELLNDDLVNRCNRRVISYEYERGKYHPQTGKIIDTVLETGPIAKFRDYLQDLQAKIWTERSDHFACIKNRVWELRNTKSSPRAVSRLHKQLDIANSEFKRIQELTLTDAHLKKDRVRILNQLLKIERETLFDPDRDSAPSHYADSDRSEAYLRLLHIRADCELGHVSAFTHDGFTGDPNNWAPEAFNLEAARTTIEKAFEILDTHDVQIRDAPRSVMLDPTAENDLYSQYRSIFHLLKGRVEWLDAGCQAGFDRAASEFEMARVGSNKRGYLLSALIELYAAEAYLAQSRGILFQGTSTEIVSHLYGLAGTTLGRARQFLLASRGHMQGRKLFFRLTAQYYSERLMLNYLQLSEDTRPKKSTATRISKHSIALLRRGYQSLLTALDLYLPTSADPFPHSIRWLYRIWLESTLTAYLIGCLTIETFGKQSPDETHQQLIALMRSINKTGGIVDSYLGPRIENDYDSFKDWAKRVRDVFTGLHSPPNGERVRWEFRERENLISLISKISMEP
ncbi:MAG TPA: SIR2 family protein [Pyrinomonadaceae bacterium]|nr:SIR2 family protein [Pyrinomonadaceae bacterium]